MIRYAQHVVTDEDIAAVTAVLRSGHLTQGPTVEALEAKLCEVTGCKYAVAVSSGTMALWCAFEAMDTDYSTYIPANTFVATANAAQLAGRPVPLVDVNPDTGMTDEWWIDEDAQYVPVSIGGDLPPLPGLQGTWVLDACHALGATVPFDRISAACVSFHPAKQVAAGEGGAILTNSEDVALACLELRDNGRDWFDVPVQTTRHGLNCRMDEMSAALALSQLGRLQQTVIDRRDIATCYDDAFAGARTFTPVPHSADSARHLYQILCRDQETRDELQATLLVQEICTQIHYMPIYRHPYYSHLGKPEDFPGAERWWRTVLALPLHNALTDGDVQRVIDAVMEVDRHE